ncbi:hypothetical protein HAX54_051983 [Datura stramonium]|uniref:Thioredoxin domain-containing protein n=1 Tax=Datura stramonium TaxID=4076 RepID=A0ABS8SZ26_DATST|nr:hypothetical protein [Datura stramonium]
MPAGSTPRSHSLQSKTKGPYEDRSPSYDREFRLLKRLDRVGRPLKVSIPIRLRFLSPSMSSSYKTTCSSSKSSFFQYGFSLPAYKSSGSSLKSKVMGTIYARAATEKTIYDFTVKDIDGKDVPLSTFKGKVLLIVNVASRCGLTTSNYTELSHVYEKYKNQGLEILAFHCHTGEVLGDLVKWNFEKFLVDKNGKVVERYPPTTSPFQIEDVLVQTNQGGKTFLAMGSHHSMKDIQKLLAA